MSTTAPPRLQLRDLVREFGATRAVDHASFDVAAGEIVGLVGHNGAGKSTVSKIVAGSDDDYRGEMMIDGNPVSFRSPHEAMDAGVGLVPQRLAVVDSLSVRHNMTLGLRHGASEEDVSRVAGELGISALLERKVAGLKPSMQRLVMIARTLVREPRILVLDEPTAAFSIAEVERLFEIVRRLRSNGLGIIFVSHRLEEVLSLSDRVVAMSRGKVIADKPAASLSKGELVDLIAGRHVEHVDSAAAGAAAPAGDEVESALTLRDVSVAPNLHGINLTVGRGEIVGITGLVGSGRSGLLNALWGVGSQLGGTVMINGEPFEPSTPRAAMRRGVAYLPENRARNSLFATMSSIQNVTLPGLRRFRLAHTPLVDRRQEARVVEELFERLSVQPADAASRRIGGLSGGNQQKGLVARWLLLDLDIYLLDEPTEGVDVGGRQEIYDVMRGLAEAGKSVLISSSDVEEVVDQCSRVYVMREGTTAQVLTRSEVTLETVNRACIA